MRHKAPNRPLYSFRPEIAVPSGIWTDGNEDGDADPGETIVYSLKITNTGTVSLYNLTVASATIGDESIDSFTLPESGLAPKDSVTLSAKYEVHGYKSFDHTQYVVNSGRISPIV